MANPETKPNPTPKAPSKERVMFFHLSILLILSQYFKISLRLLKEYGGFCSLQYV